MNPFAVHDELVFVTARRQYQSLFPPAIVTVPEHGQAAGNPLIEVTAQINLFRFMSIQTESHFSFCSGGQKAGWSFRVYYCF